jgi:hypothetical protein
MPAAPAAPTGLTATANSPTQITLLWTDNANNEEGFSIERCNKGRMCTKFVPVAELPAGATSYQDTGLAKGTEYRYRILAFNKVGDSGYSNIASAKTPRK